MKTIDENYFKIDVYFHNDLRPEENHGYKTKYKGKAKDLDDVVETLNNLAKEETISC